jgi:hypothetical protein
MIFDTAMVSKYYQPQVDVTWQFFYVEVLILRIRIWQMYYQQQWELREPSS